MVSFSCKTHIESVTPEYPVEVYEFICQQLDSNILDKINESKSRINYLVIRFEIENKEIQDVAVLSKVIDDVVIKEFENALMDKQVNFSFIEHNGGSKHISGLIKYKKLLKTCI